MLIKYQYNMSIVQIQYARIQIVLKWYLDAPDIGHGEMFAVSSIHLGS